MADADQMVAGIRRVPGVAYEAIWLNEAGLERAARLRDSLTLRPMFSVAGTDTFMRKNTNRSVDERLEELPGWAERYQKLGMDWLDVGVMAAFGCNYEGDVDPRHVVTVLQRTEQKANACWLAPRQHQPGRHDGLGQPAADQAPGRRRPRPLAEHAHQAPPARHARARRRQHRRRARDRRRLLRQRSGRHGRLPVRRPQGRGRQRHAPRTSCSSARRSVSRPASISTS